MMVSLGSTLGYGRDGLLNAEWFAVLPGVVIFLTTLTMRVLGDWVRNKRDPSLQEL